MTEIEIVRWLGNLQEYIIFICCVLCLIFSQKLNKSLVLISYYLLSLMIFNFSMSEMAALRLNNLSLTHFIVFSEFIFLSYFFKSVLKEHVLLNKYFKYYIGITGGFIILNTLYLEKLNTFNTNAKIFVLFTIIFFSVNFFYDRSKRLMEINIYEKALRITNAALLLYYSGSFFVFLFYKFTQSDEILYSLKMMIFNATLYLLFTILMLIAILLVIFRGKKIEAESG